MEVCFDCVLVLCFAMGYVLQFGEMAHKREHHCYHQRGGAKNKRGAGKFVVCSQLHNNKSREHFQTKFLIQKLVFLSPLPLEQNLFQEG